MIILEGLKHLDLSRINESVIPGIVTLKVCIEAEFRLLKHICYLGSDPFKKRP